MHWSSIRHSIAASASPTKTNSGMHMLVSGVVWVRGGRGLLFAVSLACTSTLLTHTPHIRSLFHRSAPGGRAAGPGAALSSTSASYLVCSRGVQGLLGVLLLLSVLCAVALLAPARLWLPKSSSSSCVGGAPSNITNTQYCKHCA